MTCHSGGTLEIYLEPVLTAPQLVILGESPVAEALAALAVPLGFRVCGQLFGADWDWARATSAGSAIVLHHALGVALRASAAVE